jgi:drug/metabolite transporter (DMT)-like permease
MDVTGIGIVAGLVTAGAYSAMALLRRRRFELEITIVVFLSGVGVVVGGVLILVALSGDPAKLPSSWRDYVAVAGIVAIGISLRYVVQSLRAVSAHRAVVSASNEEPPAP